MGLSRPILNGVREAGYRKPTEIQRLTIPLALEHYDLISLGETGSGKTAAFGLPILEDLLEGDTGLRALVLVPTRELCVQVAEQLRVYARHTGLHVRTAFGGIDLSIQEAAFNRGIDILVACPGRLLDHLGRLNLSLDLLQTVVLDEADRMLDMGFLPQIRNVLVRCPQERQTWLFSATMPPEVEELCQAFLTDAKLVQVGSRSHAPSTISHNFVNVRVPEKEAHLIKLLRRERGRVLVFVKTKVRADKLGDRLARTGLPADSIHGDKSVDARHVALSSFRRGKARILVATDVAARGIDVDDIVLVVNYDMPGDAEDYVHRVGRTGRAGASGRAISLVAPTERWVHRSIVEHLERTERKERGDSAPPPAARKPSRSKRRPEKKRSRGQARPASRPARQDARKTGRRRRRSPGSRPRG